MVIDVPVKEARYFLLRLLKHLLRDGLGRPLQCIQIGANDGQLADPLLPFLQKDGWDALLIEPHPLYFRRLEKLHHGNPKISLLNEACSDQPGQLTIYYLSETAEALYRPNARGCASANRERMVRALQQEPRVFRDEHIAEVTVPMRPLRDILADRNITTTDLLVIDVEGHEKQVLAGADIAALRPKLAIVECNERLNRRATAEPFLAEGYEVFRIGQETVAIAPDFPALPGAGGLLRLSGIGQFQA